MKCLILDEDKFFAKLSKVTDKLPLVDYIKTHNIIRNSYFQSVMIVPTERLIEESCFSKDIYKFEALTYCKRTYILGYSQDKTECIWGYNGTCDLTLLMKIILYLHEDTI